MLKFFAKTRKIIAKQMAAYLFMCQYNTKNIKKDSGGLTGR